MSVDDRPRVDNAHLARRARLIAQYGKPETTDTVAALKLVPGGIGVDPHDAMAFLYGSREAAEAFAASNLEHQGFPSLGIIKTERGWIGVIDMRSWRAHVRKSG
jgi:hypothetical protein